MNILLLTTHANTGGITSYILTLGEALVHSGHKVWVASSCGECVPRMEAAGIRHLNINIRTKSELHPKLWLSLPRLKALVQEEGIDIIHAQTRVTQVLGTVLSSLTGVRMITTCHGFFKPRWSRKVFSCWGSAVIAISKPVARHLKEDLKVPENKVHLITNGINLNHFVMTNDQKRRDARQKLDAGEGPLIGIIARLSDVKRIDILIKAMPLVLKKIPSAHLIVVGQGPEHAALKKLIDELFLNDKVSLKDTVNQTQGLLPAFDVFVMPSIMEGLGLSVMEAQACGVPVVASQVGGLVDLIEDGKSGYLVPANDVHFFAQRIVGVLQDPQQSKLMARQARSHIEEHFSAEMMLKKTVGIYEQYSRR